MGNVLQYKFKLGGCPDDLASDVPPRAQPLPQTQAAAPERERERESRVSAPYAPPPRPQQLPPPSRRRPSSNPFRTVRKHAPSAPLEPATATTTTTFNAASAATLRSRSPSPRASPRASPVFVDEPPPTSTSVTVADAPVRVDFSYFQTFPDDTGLNIYFRVDEQWLKTVCDGVERGTIVHVVNAHLQTIEDRSFHATFQQRVAQGVFRDTTIWPFAVTEGEIAFYYAPVVYVDRSDIYNNVWVIVESLPDQEDADADADAEVAGSARVSFLGTLWQMFTGSHALQRTPTAHATHADGMRARIHLLTNDGNRHTISCGHLYATPLNR